MDNIKKKRGQNWSQDDKKLLKDLIKDRVLIIENKSTDTNSNNRKLSSWKELLLTFNAMCSGEQRDIKQLKAQWLMQKMSAKKSLSELRRQRNKTGGGPPPEIISDDDISSWLPGEFETDSNHFDSDKINEKNDPLKPLKEEILPEEIFVISYSPEEQEGDTAQCGNVEEGELQDTNSQSENNDVNDRERELIPNKKQNVGELNSKQPAKRKYKRRTVASSTSNGALRKMEEIVKNNSNANKILFELKIENQKKKQHNLDLKNEVLQAKLQYYIKKAEKLNKNI